MLLLENSRQMNSRGQWDFLRTASRDLVMRGLPPTAHLGVVLFNEAAHVAHPLALLGADQCNEVPLVPLLPLGHAGHPLN